MWLIPASYQTDRLLCSDSNDYLRYEAGRVLEELHRGWQSDPWREIEPDVLRPIESPEREWRHLGWEKEAYSAVPGAGEAMRFAQRLGIGRHVPCVVVFTDVGELRIDVMPVSRMSAREIYDHVREWVDRFYERNRAGIARWHEVEAEIDQLRWQTQSSLSEIRNYADQASGTWRDLQAVAELIQEVSQLDADATSNWPAALGTSQRGRNHPAAELVKEFRREWSELTSRRALERRLDAACETIESANDFDALFDLLSKIDQEGLPLTGTKLGTVVVEAKAAMLDRRQAMRTADPAFQLDLWRRHHADSGGPSLKKFKKARKTWASLPQEADIGRDHDRMLVAIRGAMLSADPALAATDALAAVAAAYGVDGTAASWLAETAGYRAGVDTYITQLRDSAPCWLRTECPSATFAEALPPRQADCERGVVDAYPEGSPIREALLRQCGRAADRLRRHKDENHRVAASHRERLLAELHRGATECRVRVEEWELSRARFLATLRALRARLEGQFAGCQHPLRDAGRPGKAVDPEILRQLERSLDEYEAVVRSLDFPHRHDPMVRTVPLDTSFSVAANLPAQVAGTMPAERYRDILREAKRTDGEATELWERVAALPSRWTPAAVLSDAIAREVATDRLEELVPGEPGGDVLLRLRESLLCDRARSVLGELTELELAAVLAAIPRDSSPAPEVGPRSRAATIDRILASVGADDQPPLFGQQAFTRLLEEVASRIDELSPSEVIHVGTDLRRGLEQYLKQFLALYGPLALTVEERVSVANATLGPLTGFVTRVLRRPDPDNDVCRADTRWHELAQRVRNVSSWAGWLDKVVVALEALPGQANCFPHHVVRGSREMNDGERRDALRTLIWESRTIAAELGESSLYPICLRFVNINADKMYVVRYEFVSDPERTEHEVVAFSTFPPSVPAIGGNLLEAIYRQVLMMIAFTSPDRIDPLLAPLVPVW